MTTEPDPPPSEAEVLTIRADDLRRIILRLAAEYFLLGDDAHLLIDFTADVMAHASEQWPD
jgi:hypothetical protein